MNRSVKSLDNYSLSNEWIPAGNSSAGFHSLLFELPKRHWDPDYKTVLALTEPKRNDKVISDQLFNANVTTILDPPDLNILRSYDQLFDVVICQATLEHVCRPSIMMENLCNMTRSSGLISVHTHSESFPYHKFPVDCCRFKKDFFEELTRYIAFSLLEFVMIKGHIFVVYRKNQ